MNITAEYVFGYRHPESKIGSWDRACVVCKSVGSSDIVGAVFSNKMDYIGHFATLDDALKTLEGFKKEDGFTMKMSLEDILATSRIEVNNNTILDINKFIDKKSKRNSIQRYIQVCTGAIVLGIFIRNIFF